METKNNKLQYFGRDLEAMSYAKNYHQWILDEFSGYLGQDVAEVGAGTGSFSLHLLKLVRSLTAFEPSENMYPVLHELFVNEQRVETVNNYFGSEVSRFREKFDSVIYVNVMEHIENDIEEFKFMHESLKPGGRALIFVPALPFLYSNLDKSLGHFRRYVKSELAGKASNAGFKIQEIKYFDLAGILPWYIAFTLLGREISGGNVETYDKFVVPIMRRLESVAHPPVGKNLLMIAVKV
jgi:SAM-dependent methyltransferase